MTTSRDIARLAGVSQATVSRVLAGSDKVRPETTARVKAVLASTGYQRNATARAMRTSKSGSIGIVVESLINPFYAEALDALGRSLEKRDLRMVLWDASGAGEAAAASGIEQKMVDGVIFMTATAGSPILQHAISKRAPLVLVNRVVDDLLCDQVDSDNVAMSERVAAYCAAGGHEVLGLVTASSDASTARTRTLAFREAATKLGVPVRDEHVYDGGFTHAGGHAALRAFAETKKPPTAVFCVNDLCALGVLDAARLLGLRVPEDLWVIGYDDIQPAAWESYGLTTPRQPIPEMTETAVNLLLSRIDNPTAPVTHRRFINEMVVRNSTAHTPFLS